MIEDTSLQMKPAYMKGGLKTIFFVVAIFFFTGILHAQVKWPETSSTNKPWTRWWWQGNAVNTKDLTWNLEQYQQAGLGGVELTPIYGVAGFEKQFIDFLSPQWMKLFLHTLSEAKRLGLGVDLANGTGWPFGGPWVTNADASKAVYFKTYVVNGGERLKERIGYDRPALVRTANNKPAVIDSIAEPVYVNKNLQALALDQIQYPGKLPLKLLIAYSDKQKSGNSSATHQQIDITQKVDEPGQLHWTAPPGNWTLYALFEGLHGKMVERAAPGGEGYAIDHFSATASTNYFKKFDEAFKGYDISYLRSFFNDSYEVDDAKGQANWTANFLSEFKKRKGYALQDNLPALFGKDGDDKNSRVIYDYRSVVDELLLEHFTIAWKKWAASKGKMVRNQSHGSPANTLDLYSVVDIPETEGNDILRFKFATSAANVSGKKLVSAEAATWLNEHFLSSWSDVKKAVDLYFLGGVNHIFYHGTEYSPREAPWPGWLFYAAVHFQPTNPQWKDFHVLNEYIARVQSFLQQGQPDNDILLYYPIIDRYSQPGTALLQHFDGMERNFEKTDFEELSKEMVQKGYSFDFFSDRQLQHFTNAGDKIQSGGNTYRCILLPANKLITEQSFQQLVNLAKQGATILVYKNLPEDVAGLSRLDSRRNNFKQLVSQLSFRQSGKIQKAVVGKGAFFISDDMESLLAAGKARKENFADKELSVLRRKNKYGAVYFINNRTEKAFYDWVVVNEQPVSLAIFNPMSGKSGLAKWRRNNRGQTEILISLQSYESVIIQSYDIKKTGSYYPYTESSSQSQEIKGEWTLEFLEGGPVIPAKRSLSSLGSWTALEGEDVKNFSGTARYSIRFDKPAGTAASWILDLGKVNETAEVKLNGKKIAEMIGPTFQCVIPASALQSTNQLEIIVANLMANRVAYMDRNNIPWKIFYNINMPARKTENSRNGLFDASHWQPLPSGLTGPVTLTAVKE